MNGQLNSGVWLACLLALSAHVVAADEAEPFRVRGIEGRIAVYASTNAPREAVAWLPSDTVFTLKGEITDDPWVRIQPPETVSVWIYRELVRDGVVLADRSQVRSGAGMTYHPIASVARGERVEVRGVYGDWLKIKPLEGIAFWVLRDQVEPLATQPAESEPPMPDIYTGILNALTNETETAACVTNNIRAVPAGEQTSPSPQVTPFRPPELSGFALEETDHQGEKVVLRGTLDWGGISSVSAPFTLVTQQADGAMVPVCHLLAPEITYGPHIGAVVTVEGTRWRVKGSDLPFVIPQTLRIGE